MRNRLTMLPALELLIGKKIHKSLNNVFYLSSKFHSFILLISEMFEHMKNYEKLMKKVADWLKPEGKLFIHIFTHKQFSYHFQKGDFLI